MGIFLWKTAFAMNFSDLMQYSDLILLIDDILQWIFKLMGFKMPNLSHILLI